MAVELELNKSVFSAYLQKADRNTATFQRRLQHELQLQLLVCGIYHHAANSFTCWLFKFTILLKAQEDTSLFMFCSAGNLGSFLMEGLTEHYARWDTWCLTTPPAIADPILFGGGAPTHSGEKSREPQVPYCCLTGTLGFIWTVGCKSGPMHLGSRFCCCLQEKPEDLAPWSCLAPTIQKAQTQANKERETERN